MNISVSDLGRYETHHPQGSLNLHEMGELIRRTGRTYGFTVKSEVKISARKAGTKQKADWGWFSPDSKYATVLFEVEGRDVGDSLDKDRLSLGDYSAPLSVLALFSVDHDHSPKSPRRHDDKAMRAIVNPTGKLHDFRVLTDRQMFTGAELGDALRTLAADARRIAAGSPSTQTA